MPEHMRDIQTEDHICTAITKDSNQERSGKLPNSPESEAVGLIKPQNLPSEAPICLPCKVHPCMVQLLVQAACRS